MKRYEQGLWGGFELKGMTDINSIENRLKDIDKALKSLVLYRQLREDPAVPPLKNS